ncbi:MAG: hypothetical protein LBR76_06470 [Oscillospiraceae bacterium]|nr:hypothetical protein [Oscillospiraceae bacterium]
MARHRKPERAIFNMPLRTCSHRLESTALAVCVSGHIFWAAAGKIILVADNPLHPEQNRSFGHVENPLRLENEA